VKGVVWMIVIGALFLCATACLPDPRRAQTGEIFDQLVSIRGMLATQPPRVEAACALLGTASTRLYGEPGLVDIRPAWPALRDAAYALQAVCGQDILLAQPSTGSPAILAAHRRWQHGIEHEMGVACDHLRTASAALERAAPC
jgi:hypothetical protein